MLVMIEIVVLRHHCSSAEELQALVEKECRAMAAESVVKELVWMEEVVVMVVVVAAAAAVVVEAILKLSLTAGLKMRLETSVRNSRTCE